MTHNLGQEGVLADVLSLTWAFHDQDVGVGGHM